MAFVVFPVIAILALARFETFRHRVIDIEHVLDHIVDGMVPQAHAPALIADDIIDAALSRVALGFEGEASDRA